MNEALPMGWQFTDTDKCAAEALQRRLPSRLYDVHAHLYHTGNVRPPVPFLEWGPQEGCLSLWRQMIGRQVGADRLHGGLIIPYPSREGDPRQATAIALQEAEGSETCRAAVLVRPQSSLEELEPLLDRPQVCALKPYHFFNEAECSFQCTLAEFLPEWAWEIADERRLLIVLHLVRDLALADPVNQRDIRAMCEGHPNARLVLAHAARGFHAPNTVRGIAALRGLENVWFDSAAVCEAEALTAVLREFGPRRLMWGTDFPVSQQRGRCVTLGTGFAWVTTDNVQWTDQFFGDPLPVGMESTGALLKAADAVGLDDEDLQDIFCNNALRLLGIMEPEPTVQELYRHAKTRIPGGTQLVSKRPELQAPGQWPAYFREARGCEIWDIDGKHYYDVSIHGIGAALLGYRDPDVTRAVIRRVEFGSWCTISPPEEVMLADRLCAIHPWAEQARFARTGGEAAAVAVRIARATTDRSAVAVCGYHGWHDWYLAANLGEEDFLRGHLLPGLHPLGVPRELRGTTFTFTYNNRQQLQDVISTCGDRLAAVVMEPCRHNDPEPGFLEFVRDSAHEAGALLVFDEITIGWRLVYGGAHLKLGVNPDIAIFGKALGNGHPIAAVIGTKQAMEGAHDSFISSSFWTEGVGPAAALATLEKMSRIDVPAHCERIGRRVMEAWRKSASRHGVPLEVVEGYPCLAHFRFDHEQADALRTLYVQLMLERGFLAASSIYVNLAHTDEIIDRYAAAIDEVLGELAEVLRKGDVEKSLKGPIAHSGFRRLL